MYYRYSADFYKLLNVDRFILNNFQIIIIHGHLLSRTYISPQRLLRYLKNTPFEFLR